jgi:transposase-like protein
MTSTTENDEVLKQDRRGRVRVPKERREALLEEFARSGLSAAVFARMAGIKYPTFANWRQQRQRRVRGTMRAGLAGGGTVQLLEAVVEEPVTRAKGNSVGLLIELPGGSRLTVDSPGQLALAAELVGLIAHRSHRGC